MQVLIFSAPQILRENNARNSRMSKKQQMTFTEALNFDFDEVWQLSELKFTKNQYSDFRASKSVKMVPFQLLKLPKIDLT